MTLRTAHAAADLEAGLDDIQLPNIPLPSQEPQREPARPPRAPSLRGLSAEFRARGWHKDSAPAVVRELAVHTALSLGGAVAAFAADTTLGYLAAMAVSIYGGIGVATNTHTSTHYATANSRAVNKLLIGYGYPFFSGLSMTYWHRAHIEVHHPAPNVIGIDDDTDFKPYFAVTAEEVERSRGLARFYYEKLQGFVFPLVVWLNVFTRHRAGWAFLFRQLRDPKARKPGHWADLVLLSLHYLAWIGIPALLVGLGPALTFYLLRTSIFGMGLFFVLAPAHYPPEAVVVHKPVSPDNLLAQTATTINFRTGPIGGFLCSGLQYQIEHHLFPSYSHVHYPKMAPFVRAFCEEHGYPYRTLGWWEASMKVFAIFYKPKTVEAELRRGEPAPARDDIAA